MKKLKDLLENSTSTFVFVSLADLTDFANYIIRRTKHDLEEVIAEQESEKFISPKEVQEIISVNLSTLWRWKKKGYLVPISVGGKNLYRLSDIQKILARKEDSNQNN